MLGFLSFPCLKLTKTKREPIAHGSECRSCIFRKLLSLLEPLTIQHSSKYKNSLLYFLSPYHRSDKQQRTNLDPELRTQPVVHEPREEES